MTETPDRRPRSGRGLLLLGAVPLALLAARFWFLTDDAYISFRYARNWVEGHGLVWNPGSDAPVEGYSNLGWVLVLGAGLRVGLGPELLSRALGLASGLALLALLARVLLRPPAGAAVAEGGQPARGAALGAVLFFSTLPPVAAWCSGGLETMPFALALFGLYERLTARPHPRVAGAALWAGAAVLLRADGVAWVLLVLAPAAWSAPRGSRARALAAVAGTALAVLAAALAFRWQTYGDWLPNTARAKLSWVELDAEQRAQLLRRGTSYVVSQALAVPSLLVAAGVGLGGLRRAPAAAVACAGTVFYAVAVGGDFMALGRFLVPGLAFLAVLVGAALRTARPRATAVLAATFALLGIAAAFDVSPFPRSLRDRFHFRWNAPDQPVTEVEMWRNMRGRTAAMAELGRALAHATGPDETSSYGPVGAVGYYSRHRIHDTYGLTSRFLLDRSVLAAGLRSPGHDRIVPPEVLRELGLTYYEARVVPRDSPPRPLPPGAPVHWEERELDPEAGFPPGHVLRLLRPE